MRQRCCPGKRSFPSIGRLILALVALSVPATCGAQGLSTSTLLKPPVDSWPTYYGDYTGRSYSPLSQINAGNAATITMAWAFQLNQTQSIKSTPILADGVLYFTIPDQVWAVDAHNGRQLWHYTYNHPGGVYIGQRGVGMYLGSLYFLSNDAHLICLDARTGKPRWTVQVADDKLGFFATMAPQVVHHHVIVGVSGDFYDLNGFIRAYDPETGNTQWQWNVIPKPGEAGSESWPRKGDAGKHGGGMTWMSGTYDPDLNLIFWGIGNPNPTMYGGDRPGANLYTCNIVAIDPDTGKLRWNFDASPHDVHDWDATQDPVLVDGDIQGHPRKLLIQANRNGYFFVLDRTNGKNLLSVPFIHINWSPGIDKNGVPLRNPDKDPSPAGTLVSPASSGATNWYPPSFSPATGLFYVNSVQSYSIFYHLTAGKAVGYAGKDFPVYSHAYLKAIDYQTGTNRWVYDLGKGSTGAGLLTTGGNILFTADTSGNLLLLNATTGDTLWHAYGGGAASNSPITYELDGRQFLLIGVQGVLYAWALPDVSLRGGHVN
jgi:alcohol dehydrogenase (cytochrome c)